MDVFAANVNEIVGEVMAELAPLVRELRDGDFFGALDKIRGLSRDDATAMVACAAIVLAEQTDMWR